MSVGFGQRIRWRGWRRRLRWLRPATNGLRSTEPWRTCWRTRWRRAATRDGTAGQRRSLFLHKIWFDGPTDIGRLRQAGLRLIDALPSADRVAVHWGTTQAAYPFCPFWGAVAAQVGRLLRLQDMATANQIQRRMREMCGDRQTVYVGTRRVLRSFVDWGVLSDARKRGVYARGRCTMSHARPWLLGLWKHCLRVGSGATVRASHQPPRSFSVPDPAAGSTRARGAITTPRTDPARFERRVDDAAQLTDEQRRARRAKADSRAVTCSDVRRSNRASLLRCQDSLDSSCPEWRTIRAINSSCGTNQVEKSRDEEELRYQSLRASRLESATAWFAGNDDALSARRVKRAEERFHRRVKRAEARFRKSVKRLQQREQRAKRAEAAYKEAMLNADRREASMLYHLERSHGNPYYPFKDKTCLDGVLAQTHLAPERR